MNSDDELDVESMIEFDDFLIVFEMIMGIFFEIFNIFDEFLIECEIKIDYIEVILVVNDGEIGIYDGLNG